jgi:hypothetical protein
MTAPGGAPPTKVALRRGVLAVCVLCELDLRPEYDAVVLEGSPEVRVPWRLLRRAVAGTDPESDLGRGRLTQTLLTARAAADIGPLALQMTARPFGMPADHPLHPGPGWVRQQVLGGALDLGLGFAGLDVFDPDRVIPVPEPVLELLDVDSSPWWQETVDYLEDMGAMAALRWRRNPEAPLRPMGDCDVVTLLGSRVFRRALAGVECGGMRAIAVPLRSRGWLDLARIDPAFAAAAAQIAADKDRGFTRPVLVTPDEVVQPIDGGHPAEIVLRDPAAPTPHVRDVLYHQS